MDPAGKRALQRRRLGGLLVVVSVAFVPLLSVVLGWVQEQDEAMNDWEEVSCVIVEKSLAARGGGQKRFKYIPKVLYSYQHDGHFYRSTQLWYSGNSPLLSKHDAVAALDAATTPPCKARVSPRDPGVAFLLRTPHFTPFEHLLLFIAVSLSLAIAASIEVGWGCAPPPPEGEWYVVQEVCFPSWLQLALGALGVAAWHIAGMVVHTMWLSRGGAEGRHASEYGYHLLGAVWAVRWASKATHAALLDGVSVRLQGAGRPVVGEVAMLTVTFRTKWKATRFRDVAVSLKLIEKVAHRRRDKSEGMAHPSAIPIHVSDIILAVDASAEDRTLSLHCPLDFPATSMVKRIDVKYCWVLSLTARLAGCWWPYVAETAVDVSIPSQ